MKNANVSKGQRAELISYWVKGRFPVSSNSDPISEYASSSVASGGRQCSINWFAQVDCTAYSCCEKDFGGEDMTVEGKLAEPTMIRDLLHTSFEAIQERFDHRDCLSGVSTGFYDLDILTCGFQRGEVSVLAGRPSMGKSSLAYNVVQHAAIDKKIPVAIFSLETSKQQMVQRMLCTLSEVDRTRLRTGFIRGRDWGALSAAMDKLGDAPVFIDDSSLISIPQIQQRCRQLNGQYPALGLVVIDYVQLLQKHSCTGDLHDARDHCEELKIMAAQLNVPILAISQVSRGVDLRRNNRPKLCDLKMGEDADVVMFLYRDEYYNPESVHRGEAELIIAKHRNGPTGTVELLYQCGISKFHNRSDCPKPASWNSC
jgi:replicative DNA helicase